MNSDRKVTQPATSAISISVSRRRRIVADTTTGDSSSTENGFQQTAGEIEQRRELADIEHKGEEALVTPMAR